MNNDIVVEMKTDKANEEAGLLNKRPSTDQVRPLDSGVYKAWTKLSRINSLRPFFFTLNAPASVHIYTSLDLAKKKGLIHPINVYLIMNHDNPCPLS